MAGLPLPMHTIQILTVIVVSAICAQGEVRAQSPTTAGGTFNIEARTLGGKQYWTDIRIQGGWRIQQNSETGHFRLLDSVNVRKTWGSQAACEHALNQRIADGEVQPYRGKLVILLHGLLRSSESMTPLAESLRQHGFQTINFRYASSRSSLQNHASALRNVVDMLGDGVKEINFVGHSLGNIVVRGYVGQVDQTTGQTLPVDPRIKRMVMIGPPNQGSQMACVVQNTLAFRLAAGKCGQQLSRGWDELEKEIGVPKFAFGIIAGGQPDELSVSNALVPGKDDFTVSVEEAKLAGATDFVVAPLFHSTMMFNEDTIEWTQNFLEHGYFKSAQDRQPLPEIKKRIARLSKTSCLILLPKSRCHLQVAWQALTMALPGLVLPSATSRNNGPAL